MGNRERVQQADHCKAELLQVPIFMEWPCKIMLREEPVVHGDHLAVAMAYLQPTSQPDRPLPHAEEKLDNRKSMKR